MNTNYKIVIVISFFLLLLAGGSSLSNYLVSMRATETQIKTQSLPLSVDNIYTAIQKNVIEPSLVASMMSNDTFVVEWLLQDEKSPEKIQAYLESIKNKYNMMTCFLVSKKTLNYYTHEGIMKHVSPKDPEDAWYYRFKKISNKHEINLDWNQYISNEMIMFINYKIYDQNFHFLGATGVGLKISYIDKMLQMFKDKYKLHVSFVDAQGDILLSNNTNYIKLKNLNTIAELKPLKPEILSTKTSMIEYQKNSCNHILNTKYIPELNAYLLVEAKLDDFTADTRKTFYFNLAVSLFLTLIVAIFMIIILKNFNKQLEKIATSDLLTSLPNRRSFTQNFEKQFLLSKRSKQPLSLLFIDIDDFKQINDNFGHDIGDLVLQEFASIIKSNIRATDLCARWGGEEFTVAFINASAKDAFVTAQKIKEASAQNKTIVSMLGYPLTISAGLGDVTNEETLESAISKVDKAMYRAKTEGKNRVHLLSD